MISSDTSGPVGFGGRIFTRATWMASSDGEREVDDTGEKEGVRFSARHGPQRVGSHMSERVIQ